MKLYIRQFMTIRPYKITDGLANCEGCSLCSYVKETQYCMSSFCCSIKIPSGSLYFGKGYEKIFSEYK